MNVASKLWQQALMVVLPSIFAAFALTSCSGGGDKDGNSPDSNQVVITPPPAAPDLTATIVTPDVTLSLAPTANFTAAAVVNNIGGQQASSTTLNYYRSNDATISTSDTQVGTNAVAALSASSNSPELSITLQAPSSPGTYYYGVCVEAVTNESDSSNNCSGSVELTVVLGPDLTATIVTPDVTLSLAPTANFTAAAVVNNIGGQQASSTTLNYYRSNDATISTSDTRVGTNAVAALSASSNSPESSITLQAPSSPGTYYYGVCVEAVTNESDSSNNCSDPAEVRVIAIAGLRFVSIPAGSFTMGNPASDNEADSDEKPQHQVTINSFQMSVYETTVGQFKQFISEANRQDLLNNTFNSVNRHGDNAPVTQVSWNDAQDFVSWLNTKDTYTYRLPTEAEWEYAARAGTTTRYSWGNDFNQADSYAWHRGNSGSPHDVGTKRPNPWGLYDMHGNVWEWVQDWYDAGYYSNSPVINPQGPSSGGGRVIRGSSWGSNARGLRSANRSFYSPGNRYVNLGFRLVRQP